MGRKYVNILGINVASTSLGEVLDTISQNIEKRTKITVVTPNPEIILAATTDSDLKRALNSADIAIPDGVGLKLAAPNLLIIPGRKLFVGLIALAARNNWGVFLLGGKPEVASTAARNLKDQNPQLVVESAAGPLLDNQGSPVSERDRRIQSDTLDKIDTMQPDLLFVAFGAPKQERWVYQHKLKLKAKCIMVIGGTLDYLAGAAKLPPVWMEKLGLEWFWRFIREPFRLKRILAAVIVFPLKLLVTKLKVW